MPLILCIDTAMENAAVCLSSNDHVLTTQTNNRQMDHAAWVHTAIAQMLKETGKDIKELNAVAVASGPGSYTGLRVGMATSKGICFALNIPLITVSTLKLIAYRVISEMKDSISSKAAPVLISPMIDARRMEVFTSLYDQQLNETGAPGAMILDEDSFREQLEQNRIIFAGNGSIKWRTICNHQNAEFSNANHSIGDLAAIAAVKYKSSSFSDLAYTEPEYLKNVFTGTPGGRRN
jgi:tRNA threonylcarbamoyladenosine biosynthesis protein TsaB